MAVGFLALIAGLAHAGVDAPPASGVLFNQCWLERVWRGEEPDQHVGEAGLEADYDDVDSVFEALLDAAPAEPVVYPTEGYYYFRTRLDGDHVSGNIRFTDAVRGVLSVAYFRESDPVRYRSFVYTAAVGGFALGSSGRRVDVTFRGVSRSFIVPPELIGATDTPALGVSAPGNRFIANVCDESGTTLHLMFDDEHESFSYELVSASGSLVLNGNVATDPLTGWVYARGAVGGPWLLVGVPRDETKANSWFDGPFDQVPPRLDIREELTWAYPYVSLRGGIDEHGVFLRHPGERVAISPYQSFDDRSAFIAAVQRTLAAYSGEVALRRLTYETKRDFHRTLGEAPAETLGANAAAAFARIVVADAARQATGG